jgi:hypothetical protein
MDDNGDDEANGIEIGVFLLLEFTLIAISVSLIVPLLNLYKWRRMEKCGVPTVFKVTSGRSGYSQHIFVGNKVAHYVTVVLVPTTGESTIKEKEYMVGKEEYDKALLAGQITMLVDSCTGFAYPEKTVNFEVIIEEASLTGQMPIIRINGRCGMVTYHRAAHSGCAMCLYVMRNVVFSVVSGVSGFSTLIPNVLLLVASPIETWLVAAATVGGILVLVAALMWFSFIGTQHSCGYSHIWGTTWVQDPSSNKNFLWLRPHLHPMVPIVACPPSSNV